MTTIADALKATLDAQWTVAGGAEPTWYVTDDISVHPPAGIDYVVIQAYTLTTDTKPINETYANRTHRIQMEVNTPTSDNRLKELADEVERILNAVAISGVNWQKVSKRENISDKRLPFRRERITVSLIELMATSASAFGSTTTTTFTADHLIANIDLAVTGAATVGSLVTGGNVDGVDVSSIVSFKTITGITNDVVADSLTDTLTLSSANSKLTVVGTAATDTITFTVVENQIDHNALTNYDANKHVDHTAVTLTAGDGLTGGGTIAANRTFAVGAGTGISVAADAVSTNDAQIVHANLSGGHAVSLAGSAPDVTASAAEVNTTCDGMTATAAQIEDLLMFGAGNATYVPCIFELEVPVGKVVATNGYLSNLDATALSLRFGLPIPTIKGTLHLYITGCRIVIFDADAAAYVTSIGIYGGTHAGGYVQLLLDNTDRTAAGTYTSAVAATDVSGYTDVIAWVSTTNDALNELDIMSVAILCYYA